MIKLAVFPVAGLGTRFLPATKAVAKEMLPVVDRPLLQYAVEDALRAGVSELLFITSRHKRAIEDHYDFAPELERELEQAGKTELLRELAGTMPKGVQVTFVRQTAPKGVAHALWCARAHLSSQPFLMAYPDDLIHAEESACHQLVDVFNKVRTSVIGVQEVKAEHHSLYGMLALGQNVGAQVHRVTGIVEKPKGSAPSPYAAIGRYILTPNAFKHVVALSGSTAAEWPFTDALVSAAQDEGVHARVINGRRFDCGSKLGYLQANFALGLDHPVFGEPLRAWLDTELRSH